MNAGRLGRRELWLAAAGVLAAALLIRLYRLGAHELWFDEIATVEYARDPWKDWIAPVYWVFIHFWTRIAGFSEWALRFPSVIASSLASFGLVTLGARLFDRKTGIVAAVLMVFSPFQVWYAQEARSYSIVLFFSVFSTIVLLSALKKDRWGAWLMFACISLVALLTNDYYVILFAFQLAFALWKKRGILRGGKCIAVLVLVLAGFSWYIPRFLSELQYRWAGFWVPEPEPVFLLITLENFLLGYNGNVPLYFTGNLCLALFFAAGVRKWRREARFREGVKSCLFLFVFPVLAIYLFSAVCFSLYLTRGLIIFSPAFYLLAAAGFLAVGNSRVRFAAGAALVILLSVANYFYFSDRLTMPYVNHTGACLKKSIRPVIQFLKPRLKEGDIVAASNRPAFSAFQYYFPENPVPLRYLYHPQVPDSAWCRLVEEDEINIPVDKVSGFRHLWLLACQWDRGGGLDHNSWAVKRWLDACYVCDVSVVIDGMYIRRYSRKRLP